MLAHRNNCTACDLLWNRSSLCMCDRTINDCASAMYRHESHKHVHEHTFVWRAKVVLVLTRQFLCYTYFRANSDRQRASVTGRLHNYANASARTLNEYLLSYPRKSKPDFIPEIGSISSLCLSLDFLRLDEHLKCESRGSKGGLASSLWAPNNN